MHIGFFDSGIGGLSVLKEALQVLPSEDYLYFADVMNVPYGVKPREEVRKYILDAAAFIAGKGVKALVVACNTATVVAINDLRRKYDFPIIGMEPAVKPAVERSKGKRVLVTATSLALKQEKFLNLLARVDGEDIVDLLPLPGLVEYAEDFVFEEDTILSYLRSELAPFDMSQYGTVVLGCTHFPLYRREFKKVLPDHVDIIDGSEGTVRHLKNILMEKGLMEPKKTGGSITFYSSGKFETDSYRLENYKILLKR